MISLLVALPFLVLISLIVFGGGQVFMPIFNWFWNLLANIFGTNIDEQKINQIFTVANSTPGVVSTKFAFYTGFLVANGSWWGYLAMFLTYLVFCLPAIFCIFFAMKYMNKFKENHFLKNLISIFKPLLAGIMLALAIQLLISIALPNYYFNKSVNLYFGKMNPSSTSSLTLQVFGGNDKLSQIRRICLYIYLPLAAFIALIALKFKVNLFLIIIINVLLAINLLGLLPEVIHLWN
ncbi:chromate transporter [Mycoplasmopsis gallopavonis]|uniref:Chromate transporter n=1 Tax=Mycoplasmopsis gallopavonis TaxID=76629 RepID=A0A449AZ34_9BACT|nr:chromate transporter [Mycoplasmopsis gallopavonis]RIV16968.1 chromate transporter [Mycoplasmopsis gallopavonis]VEU72783.1 Chromate transporter [Mycoplasmopsis gallopavonis]